MGTRAERRDATEAAILKAGVALLAEGGPEALTVRGVARKLSLVPSALYRYVRSRGDLVRMLIGHACSDLADTVEAAHDAVPHDDFRGRWRAFAHALRRWAHEHPHEWALVNGPPDRGYHPPPDHTYLPAVRLHLLLIRLGADAEAAGIKLSVGDYGDRTAIPGLAAITTLTGVQVSEQTALTGLAAWHVLAGALYTEQFEQVGSAIVDYDPYYDAMVSATERLLFGDPPV